MTILSYAFARTRNYTLLWVIIGVGSALIGLYIWYLIYITSRLNIVFIDGLYNTTVQNFDTISRNQNRFFEYLRRHYWVPKDIINVGTTHKPFLIVVFMAFEMSYKS